MFCLLKLHQHAHQAELGKTLSAVQVLLLVTVNAPESKFCSHRDLLLCKRFLFSDSVSK